jgi:hypothetical protein
MKNSYGMSSLPANEIANTTPEPSNFFYHAEPTPEPIHKEIDSEAPRWRRDQGLQSLSVMISVFISWMTLLKPLSMHSYLLMQMIGKKWSVVRWIQFSVMALGSLLIDHMIVNTWVISGCSKGSLG